MIPDAAIEAAARAHHGHGNPPGRKSWDELAPMVRRIRIKKARLALEAAAPYLSAQALDDAVQAFPLETIHAPDNAVVWLMRRAEQIRSQ